MAETTEAKAEAFRQAFFPQPPLADISDIDPNAYPRPIHFPEITKHEIEEATRSAPGRKAPGEDGIPNLLWHKLIALPEIQEALYQLFYACIRIGYNASHFQRSITVVLRKGGGRGYQLPKSYRPAVLLNTLGKFLEAVIAR